MTKRIQVHQIAGGSPGQVFTTDAAGNVSWAAASAGDTGRSGTVDYAASGSIATVDAGGGHRAFPSATTLRSGKHLAYYRAASNHNWSADGAAKLSASTDDAATWSAPVTAFDGAGDEGACGITQAKVDDSVYAALVMRPDSTLANWYGAVMKSTDDAVTWAAPVTIDGGFTSWEYPSSIVTLPNGDVLTGLYGQDTGGSYDYAAVSASSDGGATWTRRGVIAQSATEHYQEPVLVVMPSGELLAFLRYEAGSNYEIRLSRSSDSAATWSSPVTILTNAGGMPSAHCTRDGAVVLSYRNTPASGGPPGWAVSLDDAMTWEARGDFSGTGVNYTYGGWIDLPDGSVGLVYSTQTSLTAANIYYTRFNRTGAPAVSVYPDEISTAGADEGDVLTVDGGVAAWRPPTTSGGTPATTALVPLTTVVGGVPELVWEADNSLALTEVPL